jgi:predicted nucleotide-binding protein
MENEILIKSIKSFEETVLAVMSEELNTSFGSNRKLSPDGIKYYNKLANKINATYPQIELMIFREDTTPNDAIHPKTAEILAQLRTALSLLDFDFSESTKKERKFSSNRGKSRVFIGCSVEGLNYAKIIQLQLESKVDSTIWHQGVFGLSFGTLETLVAKVSEFDFAILVLSPDDIVEKRGQVQMTARDNVMFELGLFMGGLGREKTFIVSEEKVTLPSDLAGITPALFSSEKEDLISALGPVCTKLEIAMKVL